MPVTPNYGWTLPTVAGDVGAWGGILNTALTEVDTDLFAALALKANLAGPNTLTGANTFTGACTFTAGLSATGGISTTSMAAGTSVVIGTDPTGPEVLRVGGGGRFTGNVVLQAAASLTLQAGSASVGGSVIANVVESARGLRLSGTGTSFSGSDRHVSPFLTTDLIANLPIGGGFQIARNGDTVAGTELLRVGGGAQFTGNVNAAGFAGSGAGLTGLGWSQIGGVPSNVVNAITQADADARYRLLGPVPWSEVSSIPANVTNAITQANGDARYRQLSATVPWSEVSGIPSNVVNAITQANGDARYRQLSVPITVPWSDVTSKPSNAVAATPAFVPTPSDFITNPPPSADTDYQAVLITLNALISTVAGLRLSLVNAGLAT